MSTLFYQESGSAEKYRDSLTGSAESFIFVKLPN